MIRRLVASRPGFLLVLVLEVLVLMLALPRLLRGTSAVVFLAAFWGLATAFYFGNYRVRRWLLRRSERT